MVLVAMLLVCQTLATDGRYSVSPALPSPRELSAARNFTRSRAHEMSRSGCDPVDDPGLRLYAHGDLNRDGRDELVVQYTLEQGNAWYLFLAVFEQPSMKCIANAQVGGLYCRAVTLVGVAHGCVELTTSTYAPNDRPNFPTIPGSTRYCLDPKDQLRESTPSPECHGLE